MFVPTIYDFADHEDYALFPIPENRAVYYFDFCDQPDDFHGPPEMHKYSDPEYYKQRKFQG